MTKLLTFLIIISVCAGCAADRDARQLAIHVIQDTVKYEAEVDKKITAEKTFYREQQARIRAALIGKAKITAIDEETNEIRQTLIYGRIRTDAERDARLTADEIVSSNPPRLIGHIIDYLVKGLKEDQAFCLDISERQRRLSENLLASLEKLDQQKENLKNVRKRLTVLATQPDIYAQLNEIVEFGKAVEEQMSKEKREK